MFAEQTLLNRIPSSGLELIRVFRTSVLFYPASALLLLSLITLSINYFVSQYPGNFYFPSGSFLSGINLWLLYGGFLFLQGKEGKITQVIKEMIYYFLFMGLIVLATNSIQFTPFPTIDQSILNVESLLNLDTRASIIWTHAKPLFKTVLEFAYDSISYQLCFIPMIVILFGRRDLIREYYFLVLTAVFIGFTFYYFFPTTAPASVISGDYFSEEQRATYLKFFQIHHYIQPSTMDGGMIALPSFHVIWAWFCLYLIRGWRLPFLVLLPINIVLTASCVMLGWHYYLDIVGSGAVILVSHGLYGLIK